MGLDQYLYAERSLARYDHNPEESAMADGVLAAAGMAALQQNSASVTVESTPIYWRKANQIHLWFVKNVQSDNDDCGRYYVTEEKLTELRDLCREVLAKITMESGTLINGYSLGPETGSKWKPNIEDGDVIANPEIAEKLLPTGSGFFFGSTAYNEWYVRDLMHTVAGIGAVLAEDLDNVYLYYSSSW